MARSMASDHRRDIAFRRGNDGDFGMASASAWPEPAHGRPEVTIGDVRVCIILQIYCPKHHTVIAPPPVPRDTNLLLYTPNIIDIDICIYCDDLVKRIEPLADLIMSNIPVRLPSSICLRELDVYELTIALTQTFLLCRSRALNAQPKAGETHYRQRIVPSGIRVALWPVCLRHQF